MTIIALTQASDTLHYPYSARACITSSPCLCAGDFEDLCGRLRTLEAEAGCAPLVCMVDEDAGEPSWPAEEVLSDEGIPSDADSPAPPAGGANRDNWEML